MSIGLPVFNGAGTIQQALSSIRGQTFPEWEVLLIDDGSSDRTVEVARRFGDSRIQVIADGENRGLAARLNQAIGLSRGRYFARMDGDDIAYPKRIESQVEFLEKNPDVDLLGTGMLVFGRGGAPIGKRVFPSGHEDICAHPHSGISMAHPTFMGRLDWFKRFGYNPARSRSQDQDLLLRSRCLSRFANLPQLLLGYREERLKMRNALTARWHFMRSVWELPGAEKDSLAMPKTLVAQSIRAVADGVAVTSGMGHKLLPHRARPLGEPEKLEWEQVWLGMNSGDCTGAA